jgi:outer membrane lipoprotein-sorting protein
MCKGLWILVMMNSVIFTSTGQDYVRINDFASFKKKFGAEASKINSITSSFTQEKILVALTEKITSTGTFAFKRANKVRIEYTRPFVYLMIMNGDKMKIRDDQKENTVNMRSNKMFRQINSIIMDCIQGTILDSKDFTSEVFENNDSYLLQMKPVSKNLKEFFETINVVVDKNDYSVNSIEMNEPSTDKTVMKFVNKKINQPVADEVFAL